jgi:hypothetical protein
MEKIIAMPHRIFSKVARCSHQLEMLMSIRVF